MRRFLPPLLGASTVAAMGSLAEVTRALARAQKPAAGVSLYSRYVNRPLGRPLAAAAIRIGITPNGVTAASALVTAAGFGLIVGLSPTSLTGLAASVLLVLGFALDSADGQVARHTGRGSPAGEWLDHVVDAAKHTAVHAGVLVGWFRFDLVPSSTWLLVPLLFQLLAVTTFAAGTLEPLLRDRRIVSTRRPSTARAVALLPADFGVLALSFAVWGSPATFRGVYTVLLVVNVPIASALLVRWFRALAAPSPLEDAPLPDSVPSTPHLAQPPKQPAGKDV